MKLDNFSLNDSFEVFAYWWLPQNPNHRVPGTLSFSSSTGTTLTLRGRFDVPELTDLLHLLTQPLFQAECIYGEQLDGGLLSVHGAMLAASNESVSFRCRLVVAGNAHISPNVSLRDASATFSFENLEEWSCMKWCTPSLLAGGGDHTYSFPSQTVSLLSIPKTASHPELDIFGGVQSHLRPNKASFDRRTYIQARGLEYDNLESLFDLSISIAQLLTILIGEPVSLTRLHLLHSAGTSVDIFFQQTRSGAAREVLAQFMPFNLADLAAEAASLFSAWLDSYAQLRPACAAFFSTLFGDFSYIDTRFQAIMQAIESFHRRTHAGKYVGEEDYEEVYSTLLGAVPKEATSPLREKLKAALRYSNEFSLRKRMNELADELDSATLEAIHVDRSFISLAVDTRNYYAHLEDSIRTPLAYNSKALYYANEKLSAFFLIHLLKRLGMSEERARAGIIKRRTFLAPAK